MYARMDELIDGWIDEWMDYITKQFNDSQNLSG
jgi:hypothetical protein